MDKQQRDEARAVADDQTRERGLWLQEGEWVAIVMAYPIYYGQIVAITPTHYYLEQASWVPDTGRAHAFVADPSSATEVEYLGDVAVERPCVAVYRVAQGGPLATK